MNKYFKTVSIFFFAIYTSFVFRVVFPVIEYVIYYEYITQELCVEKDNPDNTCHGSCYLSKKIENEVNPTKEEKKIAVEFFKIPHLLTEHELTKPFGKYKIEFHLYSESIIKFYHKPLTPPPQKDLYIS